MASITTDQRFPAVALAITARGVSGGIANFAGDATVTPAADGMSAGDATVTPAADGMSAVVDSVAPGTARITVTADADLGAGVAEITGVSEDVIVTAGNVASVMALDLGAAADK